MGLIPPEIFERVVRTRSDLATVLTVTPAAWFLEGGLDVIDWSSPSPVALMTGAGVLGLKNIIELAWMGLKYVRRDSWLRRWSQRRVRRRIDKEEKLRQLGEEFPIRRMTVDEYHKWIIEQEKLSGRIFPPDR